MKKYLIFTSSLTFLISCGTGKNENTTEEKGSSPVKAETLVPQEEMNRKEIMETTKQPPQESPYKNSKITVSTFKNGDQSWGYSIAIDGRTYINQPNIPPLPGTKGFNSADEARKTGEFVSYKIRNNIMPPSVTVKELDSLGVLK
jgi:Domain of unknown function (DUF4907)